MTDTATATTLDRVRRIVSEQLGVEEAAVTPTANLVEDLDCDSLDVIELTLGTEEAFGIEIHDDDAYSVKTVADLVALVDRLLAEQRA